MGRSAAHSWDMERATVKVRSGDQIEISQRLAANWGRIRSWLEAQHGSAMTVRELALLVGVPKTTIGNIESGLFGTQIDTLVPIAGAIGVDVWQLLVPGFDPRDPPKLEGEPTFSRKPAKAKAQA